MKRLLFIAALTSIVFQINAQTPAGNAFRIDYDQFQGSGILKYLRADYGPDMNTGDELTAMAWIQLRDIGDNQKIMGRFNLDNTGYVLGVNQFRIYPEVWNPTQYNPQEFGFMNPLSQWWYHISMTYTRGDAFRIYLNGEEVGSVPVSDAPITDNLHDLIIGISPWADFNSFQTFGNLEEVCMFNQALSAEEIRMIMFGGLTGNEEGLVAGYNFNNPVGNDIEDLSSFGYTAQGQGFNGTEWVSSEAPIADASTADAMDLRAVWNGKSLTDPRFTTGANGLNMIASGLDTTDYVLFGHDGSNGITDADIPSNAGDNFMRSTRIWSVTSFGGAAVDFAFNLSDAAGGGAELDASQVAENYTLLFRDAGEATFQAYASASSINNGVVLFEDFIALSGEVAIGVGTTPTDPSGVYEQIIDDAITVSPNPSNGIFSMDLNTRFSGIARLDILDGLGRIVDTRLLTLNGNLSNEVINISGEASGIYIIRISTPESIYTHQLSVK
jgi:hypothetical protein